VWDYEEDGKDQFIGEAIINQAQLQSGSAFPLLNPKVKKPGVIFL